MASCLEICESVKTKLAALSCPFTWELTDIAVLYYNTKRLSADAEVEEYDGDILIMQLIFLLVKCYENIMSADADFAETKLREAETVLRDIQQEKENNNIIRSIEHIFYATKCFFLYETDDEENLEIILEDIVNVADFTHQELGALQGCKSAAFSIYHDFGIEKAIDAATEAVKQDQDNALWHFILAKNVRRKRRMEHFQSSPDDLEKKHFTIAYALSKHAMFGLYMAQMRCEDFYTKERGPRYRQMKIQNQRQQLETYKEILKSNPSDYKILLKLALGFLRIGVSDAEYCLDKVEKISPKNSTYLHYRGLLYKYRGEYKEALKYFKEAADQNNFVAELNYVEYGWEIGTVDPVEYLLGMLNKYKTVVRERRQNMLLNLATSYYVTREDVKHAAEYYLKAINTDPDGKKLSCFYKFVGFVAKNGIYHFLHHEFLPNTMSKLFCTKEKTTDPSLRDVCEQLKAACEVHVKKEMDQLVEKFDRTQLLCKLHI